MYLFGMAACLFRSMVTPKTPSVTIVFGLNALKEMSEGNAFDTSTQRSLRLCLHTLQVSRTGMDSMMQRFFHEMYELASYPGPLAKGGLQNLNLDFAWNVGITVRAVLTHASHITTCYEKD